MNLLSLGALVILLAGSLSEAQEVNEQRRPLPHRFATLNGMSEKRENALLDKLAIFLNKAPAQVAYVVFYESCPGEIQFRRERMKHYLADHCHVEGKRVIWLEAGYLPTPYLLVDTQLVGMGYGYAVTQARLGAKCQLLRTTP
jgi:hypothetical protein